jgi:hypothetical protein
MSGRRYWRDVVKHKAIETCDVRYCAALCAESVTTCVTKVYEETNNGHCHGHCAVPGPRMTKGPPRYEPLVLPTVQRLCSRQSSCRTYSHSSRCGFIAFGTHTQIWLGQSGVSEPRGQQFEKAETVRARAVRALLAVLRLQQCTMGLVWTGLRSG